MKLRKISDITPTLPFTEFDFLQHYRDSFAKSELGRIRSRLPLQELAAELASRTYKRRCGKKPLFFGRRGNRPYVPQGIHGPVVRRPDRAAQRKHPHADVLRCADRPCQSHQGREDRKCHTQPPCRAPRHRQPSTHIVRPVGRRAQGQGPMPDRCDLL